MSKEPLPPRTDAALIFTNDDFLETSRITHFLGMACRRNRIRPFVRDTSDDRWVQQYLGEKKLKDALDLANLMITSKFIPFVFYAGTDRLISFDMEWLLSPECFLELDPVKYAFSIWRKDLREISAKKIVSKEKTQKEILSDPKVHHFFSNAARMKEAERIGLPNRYLFKPAAPEEFLNENHPCTYKDRIAFFSPPLPATPSEAALESLKQNQSLDALRQIAKNEILQNERLQEWKKGEPQIQDLFADVIEAKLKFPFEPATDLIFQKENQYPQAIAKLKEWDVLLEASALIKSVFKYDLPSIVCRLHKRGCLDVYAEAKTWEAYGVQTKITVKSRYIAQFYQSYVGHLYIPDATSEETLNERLFEIAACGRCAFALNNPDFKDCFKPDEEMIVAESLDELEQKIVEHLKNSDDLFTKGEHARKKVKAEYTWDISLKKIFDAVKK